MTVIDAELLIAAYDCSAILSPLLEAAKFERLMCDLAWGGLSVEALWTLCLRLKFVHKRPPSWREPGWKVVGMTTPPMEILRRKLDRRARLGIPEVKTDAEVEYRRKGTMREEVA